MTWLRNQRRRLVKPGGWVLNRLLGDNPAFYGLVAIIVVATLAPVRWGWLDEDEVTVPVLTEDVEPLDKITKSMLAERSVDPEDLPEGTIRETRELVRRIAVADVGKDKPIRRSEVLPRGTVLPDNPRQLVIESDHLAVAEGFDAGDLVDVVVAPTSVEGASGVVVPCVVFVSSAADRVTLIVPAGTLRDLASVGVGAGYTVVGVPRGSSDSPDSAGSAASGGC